MCVVKNGGFLRFVFRLFFHVVFVYQSFLGQGSGLKMAEKLDFLMFWCEEGGLFFVVSEKKELAGQGGVW